MRLVILLVFLSGCASTKIAPQDESAALIQEVSKIGLNSDCDLDRSLARHYWELGLNAHNRRDYEGSVIYLTNAKKALKLC